MSFNTEKVSCIEFIVPSYTTFCFIQHHQYNIMLKLLIISIIYCIIVRSIILIKCHVYTQFIYTLYFIGLCEANYDFRNRFKLCYTRSTDIQLKSMFRLGGNTIDCPLTINQKPSRSGDRNTNTAFQLTYRLEYSKTQ